MKCSGCGILLEKEVKYCPECGKKVEKNIVNSEKEKSSLNVASIILGIIALINGLSFIFFPGGIIFSIILSPLGLILSIVGLVLAIKGNKIIKNTCGIVLNSIGIVITFIFTLICLFIFLISSSLIKSVKDSDFNLKDYIDDIVEKYNIDEYYDEDIISKY